MAPTVAIERLELASLQQRQTGEVPVVIDTILIVGNTRTRDEVIRQELLFDSGDQLDDPVLQETERNLRRLLFLGRARISVDTTSVWLDRHAGATVTVEVEDLYARALSPFVSGELGELSFGLEGVDFNLLGRGQVARFDLRHSPVTGNSGSLSYKAPRLRGSRLSLTTQVGLGEEGHVASLSLSRPFYALSTRWAYSLSAFSVENAQRLYSSGGLVARYEERRRGGSVSIGHSTTRAGIKISPSIGLSISDRTFRPTRQFTYAPEDRRRVLPSVAITLWQPRYARARFIRTLGPVEHLQTGSWVSLRAGVSHGLFGSDREFPFASLQLSPRLQLSRPEAYLFATMSASTRYRHGGYYNLVSASVVQAYVRVRQIHTLVFRLRLDTLDRPEDDAQFLLGVDRGLRGYAPRSLDGRRRLVFNAEARPTLLTRPAYVLAAAFFVDGGSVWTPGVSSTDTVLSAGLGGRVGLSRVYNTPVLRADVARGLRHGIWQASFGVGQYF